MDDKDRQGDGPRRCLGGRFDLLDRVGVGGGAVVVRARDRQLHRLVAVKLLRSRDPDLQRRFAQESEVLASLDHPAIVRVLAHDSEGEEPYTVLELIEGPDLGEHLAGSGPLPWRQVLQIGIQIADALDAAHRQGLVHRDVKPANIMFADADDRLQVKLIDFGIVRITENYRVPTGATPRRQTGMGKALGTPGYLPLEAGLVAPNPSFDVFGLGATLYQLLTGKLPDEPLLPLREAHPGCDAPDDLELVLTAALALEPEDRTQTAAELGRALAAVVAAHPDCSAPSKRIDGRYELIGLAGTGAKADAYLAVHRGTGHDLVLKFLRSKDPDEILRFTREAMLLQTFDHSALPRFYDHAPEASPPYIAMAHAPGRPASRLCSPPRLRPNEVAAVGVKLAEVLAVVHARGVLHRDINANNVLIDERGAVTLLDFGAAELDEGFYNVPAGERRYLTPPEARVVIPHGGIGTLAWSAPEVRGGSGWSDRSDVYSMGHLLFRLLTGKVPTKGADPPTSPLDFANACPEDLASAIRSALRVDPQRRPSAAQFAETLLDVLESEEEALARAVVVSLPAGRSPLRLVPTGPQAPADWTQHPIPDATSEPAVSVALAEPPPAVGSAPNVSAAGTSHSMPRLAWAAGFALAALVVAWWGMQRPTAERASHSVVAAEVDPPGRQTPVDVAPLDASQPHRSILPDPAPTLAMRDVLDAATPALRRCSALAHGLLIVDFTTVEGGDAFASVNAAVSDNPAVDECVRKATVDLRYQPQHAETVTKEYTPMTATAFALAALLTFEAATAPAVKDECELADHRCKALLFERRSAATTNAEHRAVYLFSAHRLYMRLFDQSGDARDLCAARRAIDASLAVEGQPASMRAKSETAQADILARVKQQDARCGSVSKRGHVKPADAPLVARGPAAESPARPTPDDPPPPLLAGPALEPSSAPSVQDSVTQEPPASSRGTLHLLADADTPTTKQPAEDSLLPVAARQVEVPPAAAPLAGRGLVIAGGATLGVGAALAMGAGLTGRGMSDTRQEIIALSERVDVYATADQAARDTDLRRDYEVQKHQRLALALGSGATIVVAMILVGVGGRKMARAASHTAFIPAPGGLVFRLRF